MWFKIIEPGISTGGEIRFETHLVCFIQRHPLLKYVRNMCMLKKALFKHILSLQSGTFVPWRRKTHKRAGYCYTIASTASIACNVFTLQQRPSDSNLAPHLWQFWQFFGKSTCWIKHTSSLQYKPLVRLTLIAQSFGPLHLQGQIIEPRLKSKKSSNVSKLFFSQRAFGSKSSLRRWQHIAKRK